MIPFEDDDEEEDDDESACWVVYGSVIRLSGVNAEDDDEDEDEEEDEDVESLLLPIYGKPMFDGFGTW